MVATPSGNRFRFLLATVASMAVALGLPPSAGARQDDGQEGPEADDPIAERCSAPEFRQFDFWLGRWEVRDVDGEVVGHNEIRRVSGGCGLLESWEGAGGGTGRSINTYDADLGRWTQRWVGAGATLWLEGGLEEEPDGRRMVLAGTRARSTPRGEVLDRISWTPLPDGRVRQVWEVSADEGDTWRDIFVGLYTLVDAEGPAAGADAGDAEAGDAGGAPPTDDPAVLRAPEELHWRDAPTGAAFATVYGRPAEPGSFAFRMRMPPGFEMQPHTHNTAEHVTVLSGTLSMRFSPGGETVGLPAGSAVSIPAGHPMWAWTEEQETVIQVHGTGPFRTTRIEPGGSADVQAESDADDRPSDRHYYDFWPGTWYRVIDGVVDTTSTRFRNVRGVYPAAYEESWRLVVDSTTTITARAFRAWDPGSERWRYVWLSDAGQFQVWEGRRVDGHWYMYNEFEIEGRRVLSRQAWIPIAPGRLERISEHSSDGGQTWQRRFREEYARAGSGEQEP